MSNVVVITGGGSGLGRALARRLTQAGKTAVLLGRSLAKLEAVAAETGDASVAIACDVSRPDSVRSAFADIAARFATIDTLINNAAVFPFARLAEATDEDIMGTVGANLAGPMLCSRAAIPMMRSGGHIINISSGAVERIYPALSVYAATKAGLEALSLNLFEELEPSGIRVTAVRTGQMIEHADAFDTDPVIAASAQAALAHGLDSRARPSSSFSSVAEVILGLINYPQDLGPAIVSVRPRRAPTR